MNQVQRYAEYIGVDLQAYPELYGLMEQGLKCPVPSNWTVVKEASGRHIFVNNETGERSQDHPMDAHFRAQARQRMLELGHRSPTGSQRAHSPGTHSFGPGAYVVPQGRVSKWKVYRYFAFLFFLTVFVHFVVTCLMVKFQTGLGRWAASGFSLGGNATPVAAPAAPAAPAPSEDADGDDDDDGGSWW